MIHICGNHGQLEELSSLLQKMEEVRCSPDTRTYNILISLHTKRNDIDMATKYFKRMKVAHLEPDLVSYRTLLYAYSIRKMVCEAEELISEMDKKGLQIDQFTQSALTRMYIEAGMLERSLLWFHRFHLAGNMKSECYAANIDAYGEHRHILEAEKVFLWCQERKKLSVLEFNVMIKAYGIGKCYDKACQLFDSMDKHGVAADWCSYSSLIQILASADQPHIAKPYLKKMQVAGLVTNCIPYCAVISSFVKLGLLTDSLSYNNVLDLYANAGRPKEAIQTFKDMVTASIQLHDCSLRSLRNLLLRYGASRQALDKLQVSMKKDTSNGLQAWMLALTSVLEMDEYDNK
ncbi:pentatricopeptide repeat-containing protein At3g23020-like [Lathyrus oleraceus]|uniref:pentatricopeptide repeat-containing protein At3g23020-like n=1 Tax=Pisum sativum TaxID=3888 RepID=UPI0021D080F8|nr:pentatricopeptide repeat-containing protein At3g23020-like [Pisum sativum]